jgi:hypothetical protein
MPRRRRSVNGEVANKAITIRLTPSEHEQVQAQLGDLSMSDYFRRAGLSLKIPQVRSRRVRSVPAVNRETYVELGRIGNNINQLAKACNIAILNGNGCNIDPIQLRKLAAVIQELRLAVVAVDPDADDEDEDDDWETSERALL